jgi:hypothetical protein
MIFCISLECSVIACVIQAPYEHLYFAIMCMCTYAPDVCVSPIACRWNTRHPPTCSESLVLFMLVWPCIMNYMYNNHLDALFILGLLSHHTSKCCGRISSPSSGGRMYICGKWCLLYSAFGESLFTYKRCWKWCPPASIQAWTRLILFANTFCWSACEMFLMYAVIAVFISLSVLWYWKPNLRTLA